jgi:hypothetical protein
MAVREIITSAIRAYNTVQYDFVSKADVFYTVSNIE